VIASTPHAFSAYLDGVTSEWGGKSLGRASPPIIERNPSQSRPDSGSCPTGMTSLDASQWIKVVSLGQVASAAEDTIRSVQTLINLQPNWDGYGSPPPSERAAAIAFRLISEIKENLRNPAHVCPVGGGGIQLEWHVGDKDLEIEIGFDGSVEYLAAAGDRTQEGELPMDGGALEHLITWIDA